MAYFDNFSIMKLLRAVGFLDSDYKVKAENTNASGGGGASNFDDLLDYTATTPTEGDLIVVGASGVGVKNVTNVLVTLNDNEFMVGVTGSGPVAKTKAQTQTLLNVDKGAFPWGDSAPIVETRTICVRAPFACTIDSFTHKLASGTLTVTAKIGSTNITGLASVSVSSSKTTTNATAANVVAAGDEIVLDVTAVSSPVNFACSLNFTKS